MRYAVPLLRAHATLLNSRVVNVAAPIGISRVTLADIYQNGAIALDLRAIVLGTLNALHLLGYLFKRMAHGRGSIQGASRPELGYGDGRTGLRAGPGDEVVGADPSHGSTPRHPCHPVLQPGAGMEPGRQLRPAFGGSPRDALAPVLPGAHRRCGPRRLDDKRPAPGDGGFGRVHRRWCFRQRSRPTAARRGNGLPGLPRGRLPLASLQPRRHHDLRGRRAPAPRGRAARIRRRADLHVAPLRNGLP